MTACPSLRAGPGRGGGRACVPGADGIAPLASTAAGTWAPVRSRPGAREGFRARHAAPGGGRRRPGADEQRSQPDFTRPAGCADLWPVAEVGFREARADCTTVDGPAAAVGGRDRFDPA